MEILLGMIVWAFAIVGIVAVWKKYTIRVTPRDPNDPPPGAAGVSAVGTFYGGSGN